MLFKRNLQILNTIEHEVPVKQIVFEGIDLWPWIRMTLWKKLITNTSISFSKEPPYLNSEKIKPSWTEEFRKLKKDWKRKKEVIKNQIQAGQTDPRGEIKNLEKPVEAVFLTFASQRNAVVQNRFYNRFIHSIEDVLKREKIPSLVLEWGFGAYRLPRHGKSYLIDEPIVLAQWKHARDRFLDRMIPKNLHIPQFEKLQHALRQISGDLRLNEKRWISDALLMGAYVDVFKNIFNRVSPKTCFMVCYYHPLTFAAVKACRELAIASVDIQHGSQGAFQPMYHCWNNFPQNGYNTMPSTFWCWGKPGKERVEQWAIQSEGKHQSIVGGNPWLSKCIHEQVPSTQADEIDIQLLKFSKKRLVLVTLPPHNAPPILLMKAMSQSSRNILWLLRLHPLKSSPENLLERTRQFSLCGNPSFELKMASKLPLYSLLQVCDCHVTCFSSVAYEAYYLGKPTYVIHPMAKDFYDPVHFERGYFQYVSTSQELIELITRTKHHFLQEKTRAPFIETDPKIVRSAIKQLFFWEKQNEMKLEKISA